MTQRVLSCPPAACMAFGCPGHEFHGQKGIQGCGLNTATAPIDTVFQLNFTVFDLGAPPQSASITRVLRVISPCAAGETYCPDLQEACAAAKCSTRRSLAAASEDAEAQSYTMQFSDKLLPSAVRNDSITAMLMQALPCRTKPALPLAACLHSSSACVAHLQPAADAAAGIAVSSTLLLPGSGTTDFACTPDIINAGECSGGTHLLQFQAVDGDRNVTNAVQAQVAVGEPLATGNVTVRLGFNASGRLSSELTAAIAEAFRGNSILFNEALLHGEAAVSTAEEDCLRGDLATEQHVQASMSLAGAAQVQASYDSPGNITSVQVQCLSSSGSSEDGLPQCLEHSLGVLLEAVQRTSALQVQCTHICCTVVSSNVGCWTSCCMR